MTHRRPPRPCPRVRPRLRPAPSAAAGTTPAARGLWSLRPPIPRRTPDRSRSSGLDRRKWSIHAGYRLRRRSTSLSRWSIYNASRRLQKRWPTSSVGMWVATYRDGTQAPSRQPLVPTSPSARQHAERIASMMANPRPWVPQAPTLREGDGVAASHLVEIVLSILVRACGFAAATIAPSSQSSTLHYRDCANH